MNGFGRAQMERGAQPAFFFQVLLPALEELEAKRVYAGGIRGYYAWLGELGSFHGGHSEPLIVLMSSALEWARKRVV